MSDDPRSTLRIAWVEEWMSSLAAQILPSLAARHDITYVTAGETIPKADFRRVIRARRWKWMNVAGIELSRRVNRLYRDGLIDIAVVWASIGFCLRGVPFINLEGGSVYAEILLFQSRLPWHKRIRFLPGMVHYAVPEMLCNRRAEKVIVPSRDLQRDLTRLHRLRDDQVAVVPHGVEASHLALYRRKHHDRPPRILFVGRLHFRKGIASILEEFVRRRDIQAEFVIVGDGPDRACMEQTAAGDERVKLVGSVGRETLESILLTTNVFVFPTLYEGFGLALTEAMASGHACICNDIPVVREVLGDCGLYVAPRDPAAFVEEIARLVKDPGRIEQFAAKAHERAASFSWEEAAAAIDQIIRDTVADRRRRLPAAACTGTA